MGSGVCFPRALAIWQHGGACAAEGGGLDLGLSIGCLLFSGELWSKSCDLMSLGDR